MEAKKNIWSIVYNKLLAACLYGCFSTLWGLDSLQRFLLRQIHFLVVSVGCVDSCKFVLGQRDIYV